MDFLTAISDYEDTLPNQNVTVNGQVRFPEENRPTRLRYVFFFRLNDLSRLQVVNAEEIYSGHFISPRLICHKLKELQVQSI